MSQVPRDMALYMEHSSEAENDCLSYDEACAGERDRERERERDRERERLSRERERGRDWPERESASAVKWLFLKAMHVTGAA